MKNIDEYKKYVVICPVRNEEKYIKNTLSSLENQTIKPAEAIIVDDSSIDSTRMIVESYIKRNPWIKLIPAEENSKDRELGGRVVINFYKGLEHISGNYEYLVKMDGDVSFPNNYFEYLLDKFHNNPKLGMAGGVTYSYLTGQLEIEHSQPEYNVPGPLKMYRKECFEDINGLVPMLGWDHIDQMKAQMKGWQTKNYRTLQIIHCRPMGSSIGDLKQGKMRWGETAYVLHNNILFVLAKGLYHIFQRPYVIGGLYFYFGYLSAAIKRRNQLSDNELVSFMWQVQKNRLFSMKNNNETVHIKDKTES